jgi:hypothetical protein
MSAAGCAVIGASVALFAVILEGVPNWQSVIHFLLHCGSSQRSKIAVDGYLFSDRVISEREGAGTTIGMGRIKRRRLSLPIACQPGLHVGECVPFYWCPRSVMLFLIHRDNDPDLTYHGGQQPILQLEADLLRTVEWAEQQAKRWAFTLSNAGSYFFENRCDLRQLTEVNWDAVRARKWSGRSVPAAVRKFRYEP